jgi:flavocytochrome c
MKRARVLFYLLTCASIANPAEPMPDVAIVGAGISGLSAALEAARAGARVVVIDQNTVGGGHAILSNGAVCIVDTPLQTSQRITDGPALAEKDFLARGEDAERAWVARYVRESKSQLYDWFNDMGVRFELLVKPPGNSVPRLHLARGKGWGLVGPLFQACLRHPSIQFVWAATAESLVVQRGSVRGVQVRHLRSSRAATIRARNVIVATGGFGSNLSMVLNNWPEGEPKPDRLLLGAAHTATGSGHDMVVQAGGKLERMDHQWSYVLGLPDPRDPARSRGLAAFNFSGIWINQSGNRFTQEFGDPRTSLAALLRQPGAGYWTVFDENGKGGFSITLAGWDNFKDVSKIAYETEGVTMTANSIVELATKMGVPPPALEKTVARYNQLTSTGIDSDFQAFGPRTSPKPNPIANPPFYATRFFPITRKSMGGVSINMDCRVLARNGKPIPNLFAIGEVTGFGGINGRAALEGTFLGPGAFMGRIAGRLVSPKVKVGEQPLRPTPKSFPKGSFSDSACLGCHDLSVLRENRKGYWHFEQSHRKVQDRNYACASCHGAMFPYDSKRHKLDVLGQTLNCETCHGIQSTRASIEP